ncbi:MAG: GNAT family N-acetyltransferase [Desulfatirhabdiaceae bacterium]
MPDMLVKLYNLPNDVPLSKALNDQGVVIRTAMSYEKEHVTMWVRNTFCSAWASECDVCFSNHPSSCFIATESGGIIGFACHDGVCKNFFGPIGVIRNKRRLGIGKALILSCLYAMRSNGYAYAIIGGVGPKDFYKKTVGATLIKGSSPGIYWNRLKDGKGKKLT